MARRRRWRRHAGRRRGSSSSSIGALPRLLDSRQRVVRLTFGRVDAAAVTRGASPEGVAEGGANATDAKAAAPAAAAGGKARRDGGGGGRNAGGGGSVAAPVAAPVAAQRAARGAARGRSGAVAAEAKAARDACAPLPAGGGGGQGGQGGGGPTFQRRGRLRDGAADKKETDTEQTAASLPPWRQLRLPCRHPRPLSRRRPSCRAAGGGDGVGGEQEEWPRTWPRRSKRYVGTAARCAQASVGRSGGGGGGAGRPRRQQQRDGLGRCGRPVATSGCACLCRCFWAALIHASGNGGGNGGGGGRGRAGLLTGCKSAAWATLATHLPGRTGKECRERWARINAPPAAPCSSVSPEADAAAATAPKSESSAVLTEPPEQPAPLSRPTPMAVEPSGEVAEAETDVPATMLCEDGHRIGLRKKRMCTARISTGLACSHLNRRDAAASPRLLRTEHKEEALMMD